MVKNVAISHQCNIMAFTPLPFSFQSLTATRVSWENVCGQQCVQDWRPSSSIFFNPSNKNKLITPAIFFIVFVKTLPHALLWHQESYRPHGTTFQRNSVHKGILVPFSFVREHYWKLDQSTPIKAFANQQKILHAEDYPKWEAHRNFSGAAFFLQL